MPRITRITSLSPEELEDFFRLLPRILCDYRPPNRGPFELVFVFGETPDNADSSLLKAIELASAGAMKALGMCGGGPAHGYGGFDASVERLKALGWDGRVPIIPIDVTDERGNTNTLLDARGLIRHASALSGDIGVLAPAFHLLRTFITTITGLGGQSKRVYAIAGTPLPWTERVVHSQGIVENTRAGLLEDELGRLERYRAEEYGSLFSAAAVLRYLNWRDT